MIGIFLRNGLQLWREMAENRKPLTAGIASLDGEVQIERVVAARQKWAGTTRLYRYPSPDGRPGHPQGRSPIFFRFRSDSCGYRRTLAGKAGRDIRGFSLWPRVPHSLSCAIATTRQDTTCKSNQFFSHSLRSVHWPPAATRRSNSPCWGRARVRPGRRSSTPTWPAGHWSARWATWRTASNTHRVVDATLASGNNPDAGLKQCLAVSIYSKPEEKNRGIEHENRKNTGRDGFHRGIGRLCIRSGDVQPLLFQPGIRALAGLRLTPATPCRVGITTSKHTHRSAGHPWVVGAVLHSDQP